MSERVQPKTDVHAMSQGAVPTLGQILVARGALTVAQLREALRLQSRSGERLMLGEVLRRESLVDEDTLMRAMAESRGLHFESDPVGHSADGAGALLPAEVCREHQVVPMRVDDGDLVVATSTPEDPFLAGHLARISGFRIRFVVAMSGPIMAAIEHHAALAPAETHAVEQIDDLLEELADADFSLVDQHDSRSGEEEASSGPVVKLVNRVIAGAVAEGASDIHIEPDDGTLRVRYRVDGMLGTRITPPYRLHAAIASRIKIMAHLDISERRAPQDGEISVRVGDRGIDLRVSTLPGKFGEKIVMRVIDTSHTRLGLEKLGFRADMLERFQHLLEEPHGVILVTGPTGSGKSTTLYSVLQQYDTNALNISTCEDPVESNLPGIHQCHMNPKAGLTFSTALRALLRQDPDILMVGEIRDTETAQIAIQAALTGHLVFSTLHTNDAPTAATRLQNLGVEPFLVAASLRGVLAQRLVRRVCGKCRVEFVPDAAQRAALGRYGEQATVLARGAGCPKCRQSGLSGRVGLYELFTPEAEVAEAISRGIDPSGLRKMLAERHFETLWDDGMKKVLDGVTTAEEVHGACRR
ncbi:MAG: ATPase, T2SS/T4P/T4SS family [Planctomycetota bacterium]|nr:ATPase, T2SS/T4P/T4SS family [Planctomycetota bacterium]MDA1105656.1 ATPase, T2SS/T4P/T4SS family [Planctomycetota bacterium]